MRAYEPLDVDATPVLDLAPDVPPGAALTPTSQVPQQLAGSLVGRALGELPSDRGSELMSSILAVVNSLAVADELPLAERETVEQSLAKALRGIDRGLAELARARNQSLGSVLDRTPPLDLFRIGATLDPDLRPRKSRAHLELEEEQADWNVETEMIAEEDMTLGADARPKGPATP